MLRTFFDPGRRETSAIERDANTLSSKQAIRKLFLSIFPCLWLTYVTKSNDAVEECQKLLEKMREEKEQVEKMREEVSRERLQLQCATERLELALHAQMLENNLRHAPYMNQASRETSQVAMSGREDEIVNLNVGGKLFTTSRRTLCSVPGSMLEAMFSGRFDMPSSKDASGAYFLDRDPEYFGYVLSFLRDPRNRPHALPHHSRLAILREFEYFGLLNDAGVYVAEPGTKITCTHHLELSSRFSSMSVYGSRAYISTETHIELWSLDGQVCLQRRESTGGLVRSLEATASNLFVLCGDCEIQVWDADLQCILKKIDPGTGWATQMQIVYDLVPSYSSTTSSFDRSPRGAQSQKQVNNEYLEDWHLESPEQQFSPMQKRSSATQQTVFPRWKGFVSNGVTSRLARTAERGRAKKPLLFFDGDSGIYALDLDTLSVSTIVEVNANTEGSIMAFHVSGEDLYIATENALKSFNLCTCHSSLLASTPLEFKRIRAIENELLVCWNTLGDQLMHFDLRTRNWTEPQPSSRWHPLTEQCEVFRSLVVGRDHKDQVVLWCTSPLIEEDASSASTVLPAGSEVQENKARKASETPLNTRVISLMENAPANNASYFFQFPEGSSIVVATSSPYLEPASAPTRTIAGRAVGALGAESRQNPSQIRSGSIRVFCIRR